MDLTANEYCPLAPETFEGFWLVTRHDDVLSILDNSDNYITSEDQGGGDHRRSADEQMPEVGPPGSTTSRASRKASPAFSCRPVVQPDASLPSRASIGPTDSTTIASTSTKAPNISVPDGNGSP